MKKWIIILLPLLCGVLVGVYLIQQFYKSREDPLKENEIVLVLRMVAYGERDIQKLSLEEKNKIEHLLHEGSTSGFIFEIVAPEEFEGRFLTAHHDGDIASGSADKMASQGQLYLFRTWDGVLDKEPYSLCSIWLWRLKNANSLFLDPIYKDYKQVKAPIREN